MAHQYPVHFSSINMSLKNFLEGQNLPGNTLIVSIIKKLQSSKFIVGDSSGLALLKVAENHDKDIKVGITVKLIKPVAIDNQTIQSNKSFKPMKSKTKLELTPSEEDLSKFEVKEEESQIKNDLTISIHNRKPKSNTFPQSDSPCH